MDESDITREQAEVMGARVIESQLACPAAAFTSASVRPPASACEMNVCRPWWIVSVRAGPSPGPARGVEPAAKDVAVEWLAQRGGLERTDESSLIESQIFGGPRSVAEITPLALLP